MEGYDFVRRPSGEVVNMPEARQGDKYYKINVKYSASAVSAQTVKLTLTISWTTCLLTSCTDRLCID